MKFKPTPIKIGLIDYDNRCIYWKDEILDKVNKLMKKVDRLQELIYGETIINDDKVDLGDIDCFEYIEGLSNGLEIAIALLEDREIVLE